MIIIIAKHYTHGLAELLEPYIWNIACVRISPSMTDIYKTRIRSMQSTAELTFPAMYSLPEFLPRLSLFVTLLLSLTSGLHGINKMSMQRIGLQMRSLAPARPR